MISWTETTSHDATYKEESSSAYWFLNSSYLNEDDGGFSGTQSAVTSIFQSEMFSFSADHNGFTESRKWTDVYSSETSYTNRFTVTDYEDSTTTETRSGSGSGFSGFSTSLESESSTSYAFEALKETSTTVTRLAFESSSEIYTTNLQIWITTSSTNTSRTNSFVGFRTSISSTTQTRPFNKSTFSSAIAATRLTNESVSFGYIGPVKGIYQAESTSPNFEILLYISSLPSSWDGYLAASELAQTGTKFTLAPVLSTIQIPEENIEETFTSSTSNQSSSDRVTFRNLSYFDATETVVTNYNIIPNGTTTTLRRSARTQSFFTDFTYLNESQINYGYPYLGGNLLTTTSTTAVYNSFSKVEKWFGGVVFDELIDIEKTTTRITGIEFPVNFSSSDASSDQGGDGIFVFPYTFQSSSASGKNYQGKIPVDRPPLAQIVPPAFDPYEGDIPTNAHWYSCGAKIGSQLGLFFSSPESYSLGDVYVKDGQNPKASTLFPQENSNFTLSSNTLVYKTTNGSKETTSSMLVSAAGQPLVTYEDKIINNGQEVRLGTVVVQPFAGAYKDRIAGVTSSFIGRFSTYSAGQNAHRRSWEPIYAIGPRFAVNYSAVGAIWPMPRNSA